jgi:hypothetical protein
MIRYILKESASFGSYYNPSYFAAASVTIKICIATLAPKLYELDEVKRAT